MVPATSTASLVQTEAVADLIGSIISIVGILVTLVAYITEHRGLTLREVEPWLDALLQGTREHARRLFGKKTRTVRGTGEPTQVNVDILASGGVWAQIESTDAIDVRVNKLARNLDTLNSEFKKFRPVIEGRITDVQTSTMHQITLIRSDLVAKDENDRETETRTARWEIRGLMIALVGVLVSLFG